MANRVSVQCPGCLAKLNLPDSSKLGKKIKCPKCADIFVASESEDEDLDDLEDEEAPAKPKGGKQRPGSSAKSKGGGRKGKSADSGGANGPLIGGGIALVALLGAGLFFSGVFNSPKPLPAPPVEPPPAPVQAAPVQAAAPIAPPPAPPAINPAERILALRWMPVDTEVLFHLKVADLWQAPLLKDLIDNPMTAMGIAEFQKNTGLVPTDVESVTIGIAELPTSPGMPMMGMVPGMGMPGQMKPPKMTVVIRTKKPVSLDDLLKTSSQAITSAEHGSKKYFQFTSGEPKVAGWFAEATTLVMAPATELTAIMDRGETVVPRKELAFMDANPHVIIVVAPNDPKTLTKDMPPGMPGTPPEVAAMQAALKEKMAAVGLGISVRGGFDLQTSMFLSDSAEMATVKSGLEVSIAEGKKQFEQMKGQGLPLVADLGDMLLNNLKVNTQNQVVTVSTNVPDSEQERIVSLAKFGISMAGAMGGGNPFGGPGLPGGPARSPGASPMTGFPGVNPQAMRAPVALLGLTRPANAELAEGIPEGTTLTASTAWVPVPGADGKMNLLLQVMVDLQGDGIGSVCSFGQANIKSITAAGGGVIRGAKTTIPGQPNMTKALVPFDAMDSADPDQPPGTMRLALRFEAPKEKETDIGVLEGTFKYFTFTGSDEFTIDDVPKTAKRPLQEPALKEAGVKLLLSRDATQGNSLTLSCGKGFSLGTATAIFADGTAVPFTPDVDKGIAVQKTFHVNFPEDLQVKFKVYREIKEHSITFKFANVPLPAAAARQMIPAGQPPGGFGPGGPQAPAAFPQVPAGPQVPVGPQVPAGPQAPPVAPALQPKP